MAKILFTTPCQPYPTQYENDSLTDVASQRLCKGQDIFTLSGHVHCYGLHLIAQNISVPSILLEYPTWDYFEKEVGKGYDFIGISFFQTCMNIVLDMCRRIRELSPETKKEGHQEELGPLDFPASQTGIPLVGDLQGLVRKYWSSP